MIMNLTRVIILFEILITGSVRGSMFGFSQNISVIQNSPVGPNGIWRQWKGSLWPSRGWWLEVVRRNVLLEKVEWDLLDMGEYQDTIHPYWHPQCPGCQNRTGCTGEAHDKSCPESVTWCRGAEKVSPRDGSGGGDRREGHRDRGPAPGPSVSGTNLGIFPNILWEPSLAYLGK